MNDIANTIGEAFAGFAADLAVLVAVVCVGYFVFLKATGQKVDE